VDVYYLGKEPTSLVERVVKGYDKLKFLCPYFPKYKTTLDERENF